jgi:hypothetical protein
VLLVYAGEVVVMPMRISVDGLPKREPTKMTKMAEILTPIRPSYSFACEHVIGASGCVSAPDASLCLSTSRATSMAASILRV